jgi:hypothetical protein
MTRRRAPQARVIAALRVSIELVTAARGPP